MLCLLVEGLALKKEDQRVPVSRMALLSFLYDNFRDVRIFNFLENEMIKNNFIER